MLPDTDLRAKQAQAWELVNELAPLVWRQVYGEEYGMPEPAGRPFWEVFAARFMESEYYHERANLGDVLQLLGLVFGVGESGPDGYGGVLASYAQTQNEVHP